MCSFLFFFHTASKRIVCAGMLTPDAEISFFGNYSTSFCMVRLTRILQAYTWGRTCTCTTHQKTHAQSCMCDGHRAWCFAVIPAVADDDEWDFLRWRYVCESVCVGRASGTGRAVTRICVEGIYAPRRVSCAHVFPVRDVKSAAKWFCCCCSSSSWCFLLGVCSMPPPFSLDHEERPEKSKQSFHCSRIRPILGFFGKAKKKRHGRSTNRFWRRIRITLNFWNKIVRHKTDAWTLVGSNDGEKKN